MADKIFYPYACHVCRKYGKNVTLKTCGSCQMISYCDKEHQMEHWPQHQTICKAIKDALDGKPYINAEEICLEESIRRRSEFITAVSAKLKRSLLASEEQMLWFSRVCVICHRQDELNICTKCPCANFCNTHKNHPKHKYQCQTLKLCFEMDTMSDVEQIKIQHFNIFARSYSDMTSLIDNYMLHSTQESLSLQFLKLFYSDYLSRPFTLLYGIKRLKLDLTRENFVVHIIATRLCDVINLNQWEFLLHEMPYLVTLTIIYIGPDLNSVNHEIANLCDYCIRKKKIVYEFHSIYYRVYARTKNFKKPNVIVGFNVFLYKFYDKHDSTAELSEEWMASAQTLMEQNCPYILTLDIRKRTQIIKYDFWKKNPFMSLRPHRGMNGLPFYMNHYIVIYENIKNYLILVEEKVDDLEINKLSPPML